MTVSNYYFEPTQQAMSSYQVSLNIGSAVLEWAPERQMEIGLYAAFLAPQPQYSIYTQRIQGCQWVKQPAGTFNQDDPSYQYPFYLQTWCVVDLTPEEQEPLTAQAKQVVAVEIEDRLGSINNWASSRHVVNTSWPVPQAVKTYINTLLALNTENENYPFVLAAGVQLGTYSGWPTRLTALEIQQLVDPT